jgi:hypothetical protein
MFVEKLQRRSTFEANSAHRRPDQLASPRLP